MSRFLLVFLTLTVFPLTFDPEAVRAAPSDIPAAIFEPWTRNSGAWRVENSAYKQTRKERTFSIAPRADWKDYVFRVRARKIDGKEGFAVVFRAQNPDLGQHYFWNIGGWGNTAHGIETRPAKPGFPRSRGHIETGRWYDIKVVVQGSAIRCYLDGQLIHDVRDETYASGGIGLGCFGTAAEYRNLSVTTLDGCLKSSRFPLVSRTRLINCKSPLGVRGGCRSSYIEKSGPKHLAIDPVANSSR